MKKTATKQPCSTCKTGSVSLTLKDAKKYLRQRDRLFRKAVRDGIKRRRAERDLRTSNATLAAIMAEVLPDDEVPGDPPSPTNICTPLFIAAVEALAWSDTCWAAYYACAGGQVEV